MVTVRNLCDRLYGNCWANRYYVRMTETNGCRFRPFRHDPVRRTPIVSCVIQAVSGSRQSPQRRISSTSASSARSCGMLRSMISLPLYSVMRPGPDPT